MNKDEYNKGGVMWIRIKGQLYNLAFATSISCDLNEQIIMICFGSAGVVRGIDQQFKTHHDSLFIRFSEVEGDAISDCHNTYLRILDVISMPQDDDDDFGRKSMLEE